MIDTLLTEMEKKKQKQKHEQEQEQETHEYNIFQHLASVFIH